MERYFLDNGKLCTKGNISVFHPAIQNGDGVFTTLKLKNNKIEFYQDHMQRLMQHCDSINIDFKGIDLEKIITLIKKNHLDAGSWKIKIMVLPNTSFLVGKRKVDRELVFLEKIRSRKKEWSVCTYPREVITPLCSIKTLSYLHRHIIKKYALEKGYEDAIICYRKWVVESAFANVFWVKNTTIYYPNKTLPYLLGIALQQILKGIQKLGWQIKEQKLSVKEITNDTCFFLSNALIGFLPIVKIDSLELKKNVFIENELKKIWEDRIQKKSVII